jgi:hypothetical protein
MAIDFRIFVPCTCFDYNWPLKLLLPAVILSARARLPGPRTQRPCPAVSWSCLAARARVACWATPGGTGLTTQSGSTSSLARAWGECWPAPRLSSGSLSLSILYPHLVSFLLRLHFVFCFFCFFARSRIKGIGCDWTDSTRCQRRRFAAAAVGARLRISGRHGLCARRRRPHAAERLARCARRRYPCARGPLGV